MTDEYEAADIAYRNGYADGKAEALDVYVKALGSFIWLGNNLHNAGTDTFREMYEAALSDARRAYELGSAILAGETE
jgi:hypothetical protein